MRPTASAVLSVENVYKDSLDSPFVASVQRIAIVMAVTIAVSMPAMFGGCIGGPMEGVIRLGYFPNLTHGQALYGVHTGLYQERLGETELRATVFNAGPSAFEALLARHVDVIYVGPSPTISALEQAGLDVVVIVSGSASGGALFVAREGLELSKDADYGGKRFASPQLGNTQDIALKHYLKERGHQLREDGGDVEVINAANPDILSLFQQGQVDGAWVPEPWATRLVLEAGGTVHVDEKTLWPDEQFVTTHVVTTRAFLQQRPDDIRRLVEAHAEATQRLADGSPEVLRTINDGIEEATGKRLKDETMSAAFENLHFTVDPLQETFHRQYEMSHDLGFAREPPQDLARVYDLRFLRPVNATATSG